MKKILMILTMALAATSCMDILDVAPEDQIASENMWTTEELADKGMAGLYFPSMPPNSPLPSFAVPTD